MDVEMDDEEDTDRMIEDAPMVATGASYSLVIKKIEELADIVRQSKSQLNDLLKIVNQGRPDRHKLNLCQRCHFTYKGNFCDGCQDRRFRG